MEIKLTDFTSYNISRVPVANSLKNYTYRNTNCVFKQNSFTILYNIFDNNYLSKLIDNINGYNYYGASIKGEIYLSGQLITAEMWYKNCSCVSKHMKYSNYLTVYEYLLHLKILHNENIGSGNIDLNAIKSKIEEKMRVLSIWDIKNKMVSDLEEKETFSMLLVGESIKDCPFMFVNFDFKCFSVEEKEVIIDFLNSYVRSGKSVILYYHDTITPKLYDICDNIGIMCLCELLGPFPKSELEKYFTDHNIYDTRKYQFYEFLQSITNDINAFYQEEEDIYLSNFQDLIKEKPFKDKIELCKDFENNSSEIYSLLNIHKYDDLRKFASDQVFGYMKSNLITRTYNRISRFDFNLYQAITLFKREFYVLNRIRPLFFLLLGIFIFLLTIVFYISKTFPFCILTHLEISEFENKMNVQRFKIWESIERNVDYFTRQIFISTIFSVIFIYSFLHTITNYLHLSDHNKYTVNSKTVKQNEILRGNYSIFTYLFSRIMLKTFVYFIFMIFSIILCLFKVKFINFFLIVFMGILFSILVLPILNYATCLLNFNTRDDKSAISIIVNIGHLWILFLYGLLSIYDIMNVKTVRYLSVLFLFFFPNLHFIIIVVSLLVVINVGNSNRICLIVNYNPKTLELLTNYFTFYTTNIYIGFFVNTGFFISSIVFYYYMMYKKILTKPKNFML